MNDSVVRHDSVELHTGEGRSIVRDHFARKANTILIVLLAVMDCIMCTSIHCEYASTMTRNMLPRNGPA